LTGTAETTRERRADVEKTSVLAVSHSIVSKALRREGRTITVEAKTT